MAERFGASFTININDLKTGLKTANNLIRESQSEFSKAASGINGDWTKSEEGVKAKLDSLNKIIDVQSERVRALAENYQKRLKDGMLETSDEAIKLRTQLNNEETALQKTKNEIDNQTKAYNELKNASGEAGTEIEKSGKEAENSAKGGFTVLKGALSQLVKEGFDAAIRGAQNLATSLVEVGKKADELNTLSKQSGFTTDELQKFEYASELIDVSVDTIIGSAKRLKKNMASESKETAEAFEKLGVSVRDEAGNIRNSNDVFYEVISALQGIDNETEKDITAMQLFGKNADELAGLIDDGGEALRRYGEEAEDLGIIMSQDAVDSANEFNDAIDKIKATGQGVFNTIGAEIAKELVPEIEDVRNKLNKFIKSADFKKFKTQAVDTIKNFVKIGKNIAEAVLPKIASAVKFVADNFDKLVPSIYAAVTIFASLKAALAISATINAFKTATLAAKAATDAATISQAGWNTVMAANPIGAVVTAVGLLAAGIGLLITSQKDTTDSANDMFDTFDKRYPDFENVIQKAEDLKQSYQDFQEEQEKIVSNKQSELDYYKELWEELQNLADENGKVKEGYEKRAEYIVGQLNDALDLEIEMTGGVIKEYQKLRDEIDALMRKKKAEIFLESSEAKYKEALEKKGEAMKELVDAEEQYNSLLEEEKSKQEELAKLEEAKIKAQQDFDEHVLNGAYVDTEIFNKYKGALEDAKKAYSDMDKYINDSEEGLIVRTEKAKKAYEDAAFAVEGYVEDIGIYNKNLEASINENWDAIVDTTYIHLSDYKDAEDARRAYTEESIKIEEKNLEILNKKAKEAGDDRYKTEIAQSEARLKNLEDELAKYNKETETKLLKENTAIWAKNSSEVLTQLTGKKVEFQRVGNDLVQMFVDGEKQGSALPVDEMNKIVNDTLGEIYDGKTGAKQGGVDLLRGLAEGIEDKNEQANIFGTLRSLGSKIISTLKTALDEHSPSEATRQQGAYLIKGLVFGIKDETPALLKQIDTLGAEVLLKVKSAFNNKYVRQTESDQIKRGLSSWEPIYKEAEERAKKSVEETVEYLPAVLYSGAKRVKTNGANKPKTISVYSSIGTSSAVSSASKAAASYTSSVSTTTDSTKSVSLLTEIKAFLSDIKANISEIRMNVAEGERRASEISIYRNQTTAANGVYDNTGRNITVNQYNTYSQAHSRYEIYKSKQQAYNAVRLATATN